ncbi:MAG: MarR family winged helix-turn-helix transcriptional regulator [Ilumatobacteraceae bacterium]
MTGQRQDPIQSAVENWRIAGWGDAASGMALVTSIMRAQQLLSAEVEGRLRPHGLSFARFELLRLLAFSKKGMLPMGVVGRRLQVHPASVTSAVVRLERDGHVSRRRSTTDGRMVLVAIEDSGRTVVDAATNDLNEVFRSIPLMPAEIESVYDALRSLRATAGDFDLEDLDGST